MHISDFVAFYQIKNWRMIGIDQNKFYLVNKEYNMLKISKIDPVSFLKLTEDKDIHYKRENYREFFDFEYEAKILCCDLCVGSGVVDWITKARGIGNDPFNRGDREKIKYSISNKRERECHLTVEGVVKRRLVPILTTERIFIRTPVVSRGFQICPRCKGSSLVCARLLRIESEPAPIQETLEGVYDV